MHAMASRARLFPCNRLAAKRGVGLRFFSIRSASDFILARVGDVELRLCDINRLTEALNRYSVKAVTSG
jgi:hypothetical protein